MCSFLIYNFLVARTLLDTVNKFLQMRGPDDTNMVTHNGVTFVHNLLHVTGQKTIQPFIDETIFALYNGQIYNYKSFGSTYQSDGECLIPLYKIHGPNFIRQLHGEFAIVLFDFEKQRIVMSSDIFRTKPLYYSFSNGQIGIASWPLPLKQLGMKNIKSIPPNTTLVFNLQSRELQSSQSVYTFDLTQHKKTYDDFLLALKQSIAIRTENTQHVPFITLSSGYDSGTIACELLQQNKIINYISLNSTKENLTTIKNRFDLNITGEKTLLERNDYSQKDFDYIVELRKECLGHNGITPDWTANMFLLTKAKELNYRVHLSGHGSDEIISDYSEEKEYSNFYGKFPSNLAKIFPETPTSNAKWSNFYGRLNEWNLCREEFISSIFSIETRYPFLDKFVVQEFLSLDVELKNRFYKAPLKLYLEEKGYPFDLDKKAPLWLK